VGSIRDSRDKEQLAKNNITHILTIHEDPREGGVDGIKYLLFTASDNSAQEIKKFFAESIDFIHDARLNNGNVLVHCLAGISRSTTLVIAYIMTVIEMPWYEALNAVRGARRGCNPNFGFQRQLQAYEFTTIKSVRDNLFKKHGIYDKSRDLIHCKALLEVYKQHQEIAEQTKKQSVNSVPIKTYPLAYNAYNLDQKEDVNKATASSTVTSSTTDEHKPQAVTIEANKELNEKEKEEFIEKLFD